jgi:serine/threonine protein kinase
MSNWQVGQPLQGGRYVIDRVLGVGGAGITYRAKDHGSNRLVAIKTLNYMMQIHADFAKQQERFIQEAFRLAKCNHQHIIQVHDVCREGDLWCMVMEYIAGGTLKQYVNYRGILKEEEALKYIIQIGQALDYVHQQGFLHRDVKPGNIMLRSKSLEAVLIDFGLAREFVQDKIATHTNSRTESFAPIEQYALRAKRGAYTDVYALAATLYYILTLQLPLPSTFRLQGADLIPPKNHNQNLSDRVNQAILKGMEIQPKQRPKSIAEWLHLLTLDQPILRTQPLAQPIETVAPPQITPKPPQPVKAEVDTELKTQKAPSRISKRRPSYTSQPTILQQLAEVPLISAVGTNYTDLLELLKLAKWKEADQETARLLLNLAGRQQKGWLEQSDFEDLPCPDLNTINQLWYCGSNKRFGFSAQYKIYQELGGTQNYDGEIWRQFGDQVGWRQGNHWLSYKDLNFNIWAPIGHLPMMGMQFWGFRGWIAVLMAKVVDCNL